MTDKVSKFETRITDYELAAIIRIAKFALDEPGLSWESMESETALNSEQLANLNMKVTFACFANPTYNVQAVQERELIAQRLLGIVEEIQSGNIPPF